LIVFNNVKSRFERFIKINKPIGRLNLPTWVISLEINFDHLSTYLDQISKDSNLYPENPIVGIIHTN
jgi:hypothetical protein